MSIIEPKIDVLLNETDNDRFLLCALASKRAHDINDMMRGQRDRAIQLQTAVEIARSAKRTRRLAQHVSEKPRGALQCRESPRKRTSVRDEGLERQGAVPRGFAASSSSVGRRPTESLSGS